MVRRPSPRRHRLRLGLALWLGPLALAGAAIAAMGGCGSDTLDATAVVVVVSSDLHPGIDVDKIAVTVAAEGREKIVTYPIRTSRDLPVSLGLHPAGDRSASFDVTAAAMLRGVVVVSQSITSELVPDRTGLLAMHLAQACVEKRCPQIGETCDEGECRPGKRTATPYGAGAPGGTGGAQGAGGAGAGAGGAGAGAGGAGAGAGGAGAAAGGTGSAAGGTGSAAGGTGSAAGGTGAAAGGTGAGAGGTGAGGAPGCRACWKIQYQDQDPGNTLWSTQAVNVVSIGTDAVPLSRLTVRYWFDADTETPDTPVCNSAWVLGCPAIILRYAAVTPPRVGATHYLEIGFATSAPMLDAGAQTDAIVASFHNLSWATVNRANDYSHDATKTVLADWNRVTLYHDGDLVWGVEPQP